MAAGETPRLPRVTTSYREWAEGRAAAAAAPELIDELDAWTRMLGADTAPLTGRPLDPRRDTRGVVRDLELVFSGAESRELLTEVPKRFSTGTEEVLLGAFAAAVEQWRAGRGLDTGEGVLVGVVADGRTGDRPGTDLSRTMGRFTTVHPVRLGHLDPDDEDGQAGRVSAGALLKRVKEQLADVPGHGLGYGLLRHLNPQTAPLFAGLPTPQVRVGYRGGLDAPLTDGPAPLGAANAVRTVEAEDPDMPVTYALDIDVWVAEGPDGPCLRARWTWADAVFAEADVAALARMWQSAVREIGADASRSGGGHTPSDFP